MKKLHFSTDGMKKILVIEDNKDIRSNISELLTLSNYDVFTAENGKAGVEQAITIIPDLILCDIMMPELDGYGVLYMVQHNSQLQNVPFIFLSARSEPNDIKRGLSLGADDYITKPFDTADLLSRIEYRLNKAEAIRKQFFERSPNLSKAINIDQGEKALRSFAQNRQVEKYKKKQMIFTQGNRPSRIYFLKKGKVKVYKMNSDKKELIVRVVNEGDFFGYIAMLEDTDYQANAEAITNCEIASIPRAEFEELMNTHPDVAGKFIKLLAKDVLTMEDHLIQIAYNSLRRKVADALLTAFEKFKDDTDKLNISISRENLASITGTATESVIRTLSDFKNEKLIELREGKIAILNFDKLKKLVN